MTNSTKIGHSSNMSCGEQRVGTRYEDYARVQTPDICAFQGVLIDISETGCRVKFPVPISVDYEREYELTILPSCKQGLHSFSLSVRPVWVEEGEESTEAGFSISFISNNRYFENYLEVLREDFLESDELLFSELCS